MTVLDLGAGADTQVGVEVGIRKGLFKNIGVVVGGASGAAIILGAYEVLRSQPEKSFGLLQSWGPVFLIAIVAILIVGKFLDGLTEAAKESLSVVASSMHSSAEASGRTADALTRLAQQGGVQAQEVQRLAIYAAQEFPGVYERFDRQDAAIAKQHEMLQGLTDAVKVLTNRGRNEH